MLAKIHIVISILKQIMSSLENRFPFVDHTYQTRDMEGNIWTNFDFDTLSFLRVVADEQRLHIFVIVRWWSLVSLIGSWCIAVELV